MSKSDDGIEIRIKSFAVVCPVCIRLCFNGWKHGKGDLLRDGYAHALAPGTEGALCDHYSGWNAVIEVP